MEASEFKKRADELVKTYLSNTDGPSANSGVGFFIGDMEQLFEEWDAEEHKYSI